MRHRPKEQLAWTIGIGVVMFYALVPVLWLVSLSLKSPATVSDKQLIPQSISFDNYEALFKGGFYDRKVRAFVPIREVMAAMGYDGPAPAMPADVEAFLKADDAMRQAA